MTENTQSINFKLVSEVDVELQKLNKLVLETFKQIKELEKIKKALSKGKVVKPKKEKTESKKATNEFYLKYKESYKKSYLKRREKILVGLKEKRMNGENKPEDNIT